MVRYYPEVVHWAYDLLLSYRPLLPFIGHPLHRDEGHRPFFIVGAGRSGTMLLRRMILAHPELYIPPETNVLGKSISLFRRCRKLPWESLVFLILSRFEYHVEFDRFEVSLRPLAQRLIDTPRKSRSLAHILDSFYRYMAAEEDRTPKRWGDKTPRNTMYLGKIFKTFPEAQFIHLLRDGCDVAVSHVRAKLCENIEQAAHLWMVMTRAATSFVRSHPERCIEVRYEELVGKPEYTLRRICEFLGVSYVPEMLASEALATTMGDVPAYDYHERVAKPISTSSVGRGRRQLSTEDKRKLDELIGEELVLRGYERCLP